MINIIMLRDGLSQDSLVQKAGLDALFPFRTGPAIMIVLITTIIVVVVVVVLLLILITMIIINKQHTYNIITYRYCV